MKRTPSGPGANNNGDAELKKILSAAVTQAPVAPTFIAETAMQAYLEGRATAGQKNDVRRAMTASRDVADEVLSHLQARHDVDDSALQARMAAVRVPLDELMARMKAGDGDISDRRGVHPGIMIRPALWMWQPYAGCSLDMTA